ncbi:S8 family peptidase [Oxynema aestuarii]|uniref:S8 family peptidase n=1 Tax=Oxynema aestuarii AP17 TaxID=2064643 RepID=A0A6H1TYL2_9CYAN|nr:S8 family peptidase [Oxynema aestuarii]QIZ71674.1 S8 family peptidase [Oxynema aestuarii AP17]RMH77938.1 MAG: hypothetical protein D6680_03560 [Cyanobacteria bacterium J007]
MVEKSRQFPHIYVPEKGKNEAYKRPPQGGGSKSPPERDRKEHAQFLEQAIDRAIQEARQQIKSRNSNVAVGVPGFYLEFQLKAEETAALKSLENRQKKIELVAVSQLPEQQDMVRATVFVPESAANYFLKKIEEYRDEDTKKNKPKNEALIARLEGVDIGTVQSLFTDEPALFPQDNREIWWEVWLRKGKKEGFEQVATILDVRINSHTLSFPEREIVLAMCNVEAMAQIIKNSDAVAELRLAKDTPSFFLEMRTREQDEWVEDLAARLLEPGKHAVSICLLDSGVVQRHPLLSPGLAQNDMHTVEPSWGVNDSPQWQGHGTAMAGLCLYSDSLMDFLATSEPVKLLHRLESVKILPNSGGNKPELYGAITEQGISLPEIHEPTRRRVLCMAVTSETLSNHRGTPSSWSAAIDRLCFNDGDFRRLMVISAGNIRQDIPVTNYLDINDTEPIENPGQAWNPLVVGAYTEKINIIDPNYQGWQTVAPGGDLSPRSRTSVTWETQWPIRPDVVFEGGNMAWDGQNPGESINDLCLLTTHYRPNLRMFDRISDTSSATALASYMAARIMSEHPNYRPETVRALIVHSAEWTPAMQKHFNGASSKTSRCNLVRRYGYGVPDLGRALQSAKNDLTLIIEDEIQPFYLEVNSVKLKEMKLHQLPWPQEKLEELGEANVELKITLSYFIEPNPGERGWAYRHRYASHGLRFQVKGSLESDRDFRWRINQAVREEEEDNPVSNHSDNEKWFLGPKARDVGSIHSDVWYGTAVELAQKDAIAVYPVGGWWKEKKYLDRYEAISSYSLIVSIRVPEVDVDIYTPVYNLVSTVVPIDI